MTHILQYPVGLAQRANRGKKVCLGKLFHESVLYSQHKKTFAGLQQKQKSDRVRHQLQSHGYWLYYDVTASLSRDQDRRTVFVCVCILRIQAEENILHEKLGKLV